MPTNTLRVWMWVLGLALMVGCRHDDPSPSVAGSGGPDGGSPGTGGAGLSGSGSGGSEGPRPELCSLSADCTNGNVTGVYGHFCVTLNFTCEYGCRTPPGPIPLYRDDDASLAYRIAGEALCELPDGSVAPAADAGPPDGAETCAPQLMNGSDTGLDTCADGSIHRRAAVACPGIQGTPGGGRCWTDADCGAGSICICDASANGGGQCVPAGCATERDCPTGQGCIATVRADQADACAPAGPTSFDCQTPNDACTTNADCGDSPATPRECRLVGEQRVCGCKSI